MSHRVSRARRGRMAPTTALPAVSISGQVPPGAPHHATCCLGNGRMQRAAPAAVVLAGLLAANPALADETEQTLSYSDTAQPVRDSLRESEVGVSPVEEATATVPVHEGTITFNALALVFGGLHGEIEQVVSSSMSWFFGPALAYGSAGDDSLIGIGLTTGLRFFPSGGGAPAGFWIGPQAIAQFNFATIDDKSVSGGSYGIGGLLGYTWVFDSAFTLSLGGGLQFYKAAINLDGGDLFEGFGRMEKLDTTGFGSAVRLSLGWAF